MFTGTAQSSFTLRNDSQHQAEEAQAQAQAQAPAQSHVQAHVQAHAQAQANRRRTCLNSDELDNRSLGIDPRSIGRRPIAELSRQAQQKQARVQKNANILQDHQLEEQQSAQDQRYTGSQDLPFTQDSFASLRTFGRSQDQFGSDLEVHDEEFGGQLEDYSEEEHPTPTPTTSRHRLLRDNSGYDRNNSQFTGVTAY